MKKQIKNMLQIYCSFIDLDFLHVIKKFEGNLHAFKLNNDQYIECSMDDRYFSA